jgi:hypothetical protein
LEVYPKMKRQAINYVANCIPDLKKGVNAIEAASRTETHENVCLRILALRKELDLMAETIAVIHDQQELELV